METITSLNASLFLLFVVFLACVGTGIYLIKIYAFDEYPSSKQAVFHTSSPTSIQYTSTTFLGTTFLNETSIKSISFSYPVDIALDSNGNVFICDSGYHMIRKITPSGEASVVVGGLGGSGNVDGVGTGARFNAPSSLAFDNSGALFVSDSGNHVIRKITPTTQVSTTAGLSGTSGLADGAGTTARFFYPLGLTFDTSSGNLFVIDGNNHVVRKVTNSGTIVTTFVGKLGNSGYADGIGTSVMFENPHYMDVDASGNLFVTDFRNSALRKINSSGIVTTFYRNTTLLKYPYGVVVGSNGNIYISERYNNAIVEVTSSGVGTIIAGSVTSSSGYDDGLGTTARFCSPSNMAFDSNGNLLVTDALNALVRQVSLSHEVTTYAGTSGLNSVTVDSHTNLFPQALTSDTNGNIYLFSTRCIIYKVSPDGVLVVLAGQHGQLGSSDGVGTNALFTSVKGLSVDPTNGNLLAVDVLYSRIRIITPNRMVTTFAGSTSGFADGVGTSAKFSSPSDVTVDTNGVTYVGDTYNYVIRKITPQAVVTTLAGVATSRGYIDGIGTNAKFHNVVGITVDSNGNLFVTEIDKCVIRKITPSAVVSTVVGSSVCGFSNGIGTSVQFNQPIGIALDSSGYIYVTDSENYNIRRITPAFQVTTITGSSTAASKDGMGTNIQFVRPGDITVDSTGTIYVSDSGVGLIRKLHRL